MKINLLIFTLLIWTTSFGQLSKLKGTWITDSNDVMVIKDTVNQSEDLSIISNVEQNEEMALFLSGDTLSFRQWYYSSRTHYQIKYIDKYDFYIENKTDSTLTVKPISDLSKSFFGNRTNIIFTKEEFNRDTSIAFEKLIFHTGSHFIIRYKIELEIDKNKEVYLKALYYKVPPSQEVDSVKSGAFKGKLSHNSYNELISILQTCNLQNLKFPNKLLMDASLKTLIIYYSGRRKYLQSYMHPMIANKLFQFLNNINERVELTRTNEVRILEK